MRIVSDNASEAVRPRSLKRLEDMTDEEIEKKISELRAEGKRHMEHSAELLRYKAERNTPSAT